MMNLSLLFKSVKKHDKVITKYGTFLKKEAEAMRTCTCVYKLVSYLCILPSATNLLNMVDSENNTDAWLLA